MKTCLEYMGLNIYKFLITQYISADIQGPKEKENVAYFRLFFKSNSLIGFQMILCTVINARKDTDCITNRYKSSYKLSFPLYYHVEWLKRLCGTKQCHITFFVLSPF